MKVFITGGLGFVGRGLALRLAYNGHRVTLLDRIHPGGELPDGVAAIAADALSPGPWQDVVADHDAVINLAGVSIFTRWSARKKKDIYDSRIRITRNLIDALKGGNAAGTTLISASATGYYGFRDDAMVTESDPPGDDFLARVCHDWEAEAMKADGTIARTVIARFGVVLGPGGGALDVLAKLFRARLGCRLGSGRQWFSWISRGDLESALIFLLENHAVQGPVNCTSPVPVTNRELTRALNRALGTFPLVPPAPAFLLKATLGEFGDFLLKGQRVVPRRLLDLGFVFESPEMGPALGALFA